MNRRQALIDLTSLVTTAAVFNESALSDGVSKEQWQEIYSEIYARDIAEYLMNNGHYPESLMSIHKDSRTPGHYEIRKKLPDNRKLVVYFCNVNNKKVKYCEPNSRLEITITPSRDDQIGFETAEWGLKGKFTDFRILTGKNSWYHVSSIDQSDTQLVMVQRRYHQLLHEVYHELSGK